ncbi:unnamed protein product [Symbiodinium microadriaticum]|nr:unnamed protein product [Symbiodinium sp. KB8]CAE7692344.1 unnamed protein product [Symbiodinium microadriaticum]
MEWSRPRQCVMIGRYQILGEHRRVSHLMAHAKFPAKQPVVRQVIPVQAVRYVVYCGAPVVSAISARADPRRASAFDVSASSDRTARRGDAKELPGPLIACKASSEASTCSAASSHGIEANGSAVQVLPDEWGKAKTFLKQDLDPKPARIDMGPCRVPMDRKFADKEDLREIEIPDLDAKLECLKDGELFEPPIRILRKLRVGAHAVEDVEVKVAVYDLPHCSALNSALLPFGSGAYHVAVQVLGAEFSYGDRPGAAHGTGVWSYWPDDSDDTKKPRRLLSYRTKHSETEVEPADKLPSCRKDLNMEGQVSDVHVPLVRSNFCRLSLSLEPTMSLQEGRKKQMAFVQALKSKGLKSKITGNEGRNLWCTPHRSPEERNRIKAVISVKEFAEAVLRSKGSDQMVEFDWRGMVYIERYQILGHVDGAASLGEHGVFLMDNKGNHTGWVIRSTQAQALGVEEKEFHELWMEFNLRVGDKITKGLFHSPSLGTFVLKLCQAFQET